MSVSVDIDFKDLIREAIVSGTETDPMKIGAQIVDSLADDELRPALLSIVRSIVQTEQAALRNNTIKPLREYPLDESVGVKTTPSTKSKTPKVGRPRIGLFVDYLERFRKSTMVVEGVTKAMNECSADDFLWVAESLRVKATGYIANAEMYENIAATMKTTKAKTLADVPNNDLAKVVKE